MDDKHRVERVVQAEKVREPAFIIRGSEMSRAIGEAAGQLRRTAYALAPEIRNVYLKCRAIGRYGTSLALLMIVHAFFCGTSERDAFAWSLTRQLKSCGSRQWTSSGGD
jgi:hypothetical protein